MYLKSNYPEKFKELIASKGEKALPYEMIEKEVELMPLQIVRLTKIGGYKDRLTELLVHYKGPVIGYLLPCIDLSEKMFVWPLASKKFRQFVSVPTQHNFAHYVRSSLFVYAHLLSPNQNRTLKRLERKMDWSLARILIRNANFTELKLTWAIRNNNYAVK